MGTWYSKEVGDGAAASGPSNAVQEAYLTLVSSGQHAADMAVFSHYDLSANTVTFYFTPSVFALAAKFGATKCDKPTPQRGFGLLVGDQRSWEIHFPGYAPDR